MSPSPSRLRAWSARVSSSATPLLSGESSVGSACGEKSWQAPMESYASKITCSYTLSLCCLLPWP